MAISFGNATGDLFTILGKIAATVKNGRSNQGTQYTALTSSATGVVGQLNNEPDVQAITGAGYISALNTIASQIGALARQQSEAVVNRVVFRDAPRIDQTLTQTSTLASLREIIRQMLEQGATVRACTVSTSVASFLGKGNGVVICSSKRPFDGRTLENSFSESIKVLCDRDSYTGGATAAQEGFTASGAGRQDDLFAFDWPLGSGASLNLTAIDNASDASGGNFLTNSGFDAWSGGLPDQWDVITGSGLISQDTGVIYGGTSSLKFSSDGATLLKLRQKFDDSTLGTAGALEPLSQYSWSGWLQRSGVLSAAGTLRVSLTDDGGTVIKDAGGADNVIDIDLTTLATLYNPFTGVFRTPRVLPDELYLQYELTAAYDNGKAFYIDHTGLGSMGQMYASGPYLSVHSGHEPFQQNDLCLVAVTNSRGAAGTLDTFQTFLARMFPDLVYEQELLFPSSGSPSLPDSMIA